MTTLSQLVSCVSQAAGAIEWSRRQGLLIWAGNVFCLPREDEKRGLKWAPSSYEDARFDRWLK